ncbi:putative purine-cytosine permease fcy22 protein [Venturia nashicola]|uniref:Putative purine-cytosine permease fcy22 protein n=1 Tax=Venturia nashicola TaxID=86259 RepID=A0A4Z1PDZ4_9PEZI|nr:putative purine-cytosine permease fcy22 protein [Venturia nashicola]
MSNLERVLDHNRDIETEKKNTSEFQRSIVEAGEATPLSIWKRITSSGIEMRGIEPVPIEERNDKNGFNIFTMWWSISLTLLAVTTGLVGTLYGGLSLQAASLTILFFTLFAAIPPAALGTLGPQTGMRQIVQARYSFGLYAVTIVAIFNLATTTGWCIISTIVAGQTLSAVSGGSLSWNLGIVIITLIALIIAFLGYKVVHQYERWCWIPALVAITITAGCGGHLLKNQAPAEPATAAGVLTFGCVVTSFTLTWALMASDFSVYTHPSVNGTRIFLSIYLGLVLPGTPLMILGASIGGAILSNPSLAPAFDTGSIGGAMLFLLESSYIGNFAKFVSVILAFTVLGNLAGTIYSISIQFQCLLPIFTRIPRWVFSILISAIIIAAAIPISKSLATALENFLALIAYWGAVYVAVVSMEHLVFRKSAKAYDAAIWNDGRRLAMGLAAVGAVAVPFALIVPSMAVTWFTGPIARKTGDIGFEVGGVLAVGIYVPLRWLERRWSGR